MSENFKVFGEDNAVEFGAGVELHGHIVGKGNRVHIAPTMSHCRLHLFISGDNNQVFIDRNAELKDLGIWCGNHVKAHNTQLHIGAEFSIENGGRFFLFNSGNRLRIGDHCMFSTGVTVRCGESPHLLFDQVSGDYLDVSDGVDIGHHVWVGESAYITKSVSIGDETVVGAHSVVTKRFTETHVALAGNPARVVREHLQWIRNPSMLLEGTPYHAAYAERLSAFPHPKEDGQNPG